MYVKITISPDCAFIV